jgi:2-keto-3-deoxy-L-rhamnonate aldolase RhmA
MPAHRRCFFRSYRILTKAPRGGVDALPAARRGRRHAPRQPLRTVPNYLQRANDEVCVIVQIETPSAFDQLEAIAAVPGVDSIFIGPADLRVDGFLGDMGNAAVQEKLKAGAQLCKRIGKPCGIVGANPDMAGRFVEYGFSWVAVGSDLAYVVTREPNTWRMRGAVPAAASKSQSAY